MKIQDSKPAVLSGNDVGYEKTNSPYELFRARRPEHLQPVWRVRNLPDGQRLRC